MKIGLITAIPSSELPPSHLYAQTLSIPLGLLYIGTYLLDHRADVEVLMRDNPILLIEEKPDVLGIYSVTQNFTYACKLAAMAKEQNIVTVVGGPHITALPNGLPQEFDFGVIGEGERTFLDLIDGLCQGASVTDDRWKSVPGLVYHENNDGVSRCYYSGRRPQEKDLDHFPHPRRELWVKRLGIAHMTTSRGCPYSCSYCSEPVLWESYRTHSPQYVLKEIQDLCAHFDVPHILMADDIFTISQPRLEQLARLFEENNLPRTLAFSGWGRASLLTDEMATLLKRMNFVYLAFGMESASPSILSRIKKGATIATNQRAIDLCHKTGLKVGCTFVISSPGETAEDLRMTYEFIKRNRAKISGIEINPAIPLPGTPLWNDALSRGLVREDMDDWDRFRDYSVFEDFDPERYIAINDHFSDKTYQEWFHRIGDLYHEIVDRGEMAELTLDYLNPTMEKAEFLK